jgi:hypothetical protein
MFCYAKLCIACNNYNKYCTCLEENVETKEISAKPTLDESLNSKNIQEYEEVIELWKTYGGD